MRQVLFLLLTTLAFHVNASQSVFYSTSEIEAGWKYWDSEYSWNYLIENGEKINPIPSNYNTEYVYSSTGIKISYVRQNKIFWVDLYFGYDSFGMIFNNFFAVSPDMYDYNYVISRDWFQIDLEHIVYDSVFDRIMIPCGVDDCGNHNAICFTFKDNSGYAPKMDNDELEETKYFNLSGIAISPDSNKEGIIIEKRGNKTKKVIQK